MAILSFWSPENVIEMRAARNQLIDVNKKISPLAKDLAILVEEQSTLENTTPFSSITHYHIANVIKETCLAVNPGCKLKVLRIRHLMCRFPQIKTPDASPI